MHLRISLGTKFQLKLTIVIFWTKFTQKGYFWQETEKVNNNIEYWNQKMYFQPRMKKSEHNFLDFAYSDLFKLHNTITILMSLLQKVPKIISK